ncbi:hypothetical protein QOZ80_2AG0150430 [Eleusine coracana subsp. coracana]|nr:hypothetical protein QOZ80_2AG0150430 [Eleusine coracana subsp. coracana]
METSDTSAVGDGVSSGGPSEGDGSTTTGRSYYERFGYPDAASHFEAKRQETLAKYMTLVSPVLQPVLAKDSAAKFEFIFPEVFLSIISMNAVRCAKVALSGDVRRRADPNGRHRYGFHAAAETFSVDMVKLLLRHGASANIRTEGDNVIEALEKYIQAHSEVLHEEILEHVSSILNSNGIVPYGKGIDTGNLKGYYCSFGVTSIDKSDSQADSGPGEPNEDDKSSLNGEGIKKIRRKALTKGLALRDVRNNFFPFWKSVLSARLQVSITPPPCELSVKDRKARQCTEPSRKGVKVGNKSTGHVTTFNLISSLPPHLGSQFECRRQLCTVALTSLKLLRRT